MASSVQYTINLDVGDELPGSDQNYHEGEMLSEEDASLPYQEDEEHSNWDHDTVDERDPERDIAGARLTLVDRINSDTQTKWENEASWNTQPGYEEYRTDIKALLRIERDCLASTSSDTSPPNFLQHVLEQENALSFYPHSVRLQKIKFLLKLIVELDPSQLSPKYGLRPLHAAVDVDIKIFKQGKSRVKPDITIYMCHLMKDQAADEICRMNKHNQNILHLAILHDLRGVEDLIRKANPKAFTTQKRSEAADDGNTPLHDALEARYFIRQVAACPIPAETSSASTAGSDLRRPSITQRPVTTGQVPSTSTFHPVQPKYVSNQVRTRSVVAPALQGKQPQRLRATACKICVDTRTQNDAAVKKKKGIIKLLLEQTGGKNALTIHNSAGLSPYLYLYASYRSWVEQQRTKSSSAGDSPSTPPPQINVMAEEAPVEKRPGKEGSERKSKSANEKNDDSEAKRIEAEEKEKKLKAQRVDSSSRRHGEGVVKSVGQGNKNAGGIREPVRNNFQARSHIRAELREEDIGCEDILKQLREFSFQLGGYKKACECLFRNQTLKGHSPFAGELRWFSLEGTQRVTSSTTNDFDFLNFEPMMSSVVLSMEYTQEMLETLPNMAQDKITMWAQDEENLKQVFEWLKETKGVKTILSLVVKDNPHHYCSDNTVEECLKGLEVIYLNWNRPDLCANKYTLPPTLVEISLYWTGLNSVLWSWSDTEGLRTLAKGTDLENKSRKAKVDAFQDRVNKWAKRKHFKFIEVRYDDMGYKGSGKTGGLNSLSTRIHPWRSDVSGFRDKLLTLCYDEKSRSNRPIHVKVALLDDGVDPTYKRNGEYMHHTGWPPVDSGEPEEGSGSFYVSTNQHGSKMAWLIRQVCPYVTIYVAKLDVNIGEGLRQRSFSLRQATKAINWAKDQKVDIISMSWNARRVSPATGIANDSDIHDLEQAIAGAHAANILMFGAACDVKQSSSSDEWIPCDNSKVFSIGATDTEFDVKKYVDMTKTVNFLFPGEYVLGQSEEAEVGNSGATALATGLAALVLFCMLFEHEPLPANRHAWMNNIFSKVFDGETNKKVVHVKKVLRMDDEGSLRLLVQKFVSQKD
ncbi:hypothetical protein J7T55_004974 [Diaporthe amygdali]|uniref:uncharacterized protein n=1 Tax=Phomopsis amygdali TaxID=1214568 RepID=UPI0022FE0339|nr:uncharacterized protein J7T55_004974 [Diaporthe amygdali]KAJ0116030.1 hypothetical protein J7T55_004974 [Diaporthe amygdali]